MSVHIATYNTYSGTISEFYSRTCAHHYIYEINIYTFIAVITVELHLSAINWDGEPSGYAEYPHNLSFLGKQATLAV